MRIRNLLVGLALVLMASLALAACGDGEPGSSGGSLTPSEKAAAKQAYERSMGQVAGTLDDGTTPPFQFLIDKGIRKGLLEAAQNWDKATTLAAGISPPADIIDEHRDLVAAMRKLSAWNLKIAKAAPNVKRTKVAAAQAMNSQASKDFKAAIDAIQAKGYQVMGTGEASPLDSAGTP